MHAAFGLQTPLMSKPVKNERMRAAGGMQSCQQAAQLSDDATGIDDLRKDLKAIFDQPKPR